MPRLFHKQTEYKQQSPDAMYESDYEKLVYQLSPELFPNFLMVEFKSIVCNETESAKADFALIHKQYKAWWVVEVEMADHSLERHVIPQIQVLLTARYGSETINSLVATHGSLDRSRLTSMVKNQQPRILVIVNKNIASWNLRLEKMGVEIMSLEVYISQYNQYIFKVDGGLPPEKREVITICHTKRSIPGILTVDSPGSLNVTNGQIIKIAFEGLVTEWRRRDLLDSVWLMPTRSFPLPDISVIEICSDEESNYYFRLIKE